MEKGAKRSYARHETTSPNTVQAKLAADALGKKITGIDASASSKMVETAMLLANQDAKGTFLSIALFNLCMMHANGAVTDNSMIKELFIKSLDSSANMTSGSFNSNPGQVSAGDAKPAAGDAKPAKQ